MYSHFLWNKLKKVLDDDQLASARDSSTIFSSWPLNSLPGFSADKGQGGEPAASCKRPFFRTVRYP